jgi:hypothetical protein
MYRFAAVVVTASCVLAAAVCSGQEAPNLPEGVTHVALPPGTLELKNILKNGKPLLRLTVDKLVIHARDLYLGDGKHATKYEATKEGVHWAGPSGRKGGVTNGYIHEPGSTIGVEGGDYWKVGQLKPGSVYLTTPSIKFDFKP